MGKTMLVPKVVRALGIPGTVRNWRTVRTLADLAARS
jgi:uncharacterized protein (DUF1697 family)